MLHIASHFQHLSTQFRQVFAILELFMSALKDCSAVIQESGGMWLGTRSQRCCRLSLGIWSAPAFQTFPFLSLSLSLSLSLYSLFLSILSILYLYSILIYSLFLFFILKSFWVKISHLQGVVTSFRVSRAPIPRHRNGYAPILVHARRWRSAYR